MILSREGVKATVIIPVFNSDQILQRCLEALSYSHFRDFDIIVVADCSTDNSLQIARDFGCKVISLKKRSGPAHARNRGAEAANSQLLVFLDSDVLCEPETLGRIIKPLEEGWDACVGTYTPIPGYSNFFSIYKNIFIQYYHDISGSRIDWFWTACGAIKKDAFNDLGGFSKFFSWKSVEDIDFGYRMTKMNYKIFFNKEASVKHFHSFDFMDVLKNDFKKGRDWTYFNLTQNRSLSLKHPVAQFKYRGLGILVSLLFVLILIFSTIEFYLFPLAVFIFLISPFIEKGFFSSLLRYGGVRIFTIALFFKPIDDLVISIGAFVGLIRFLFKR